MIDAISPRERLSRLSPNRWEHRLSLLFFVIAMLLCLALMCENVNAAPQESVSARTEACCSAPENVSSALTDNALKPAAAAPNFYAALQEGRTSYPISGLADAASLNSALGRPVGAAPFTLAHPICQTGFWIKQRIDDRDRNGIIIKSRWVFGCAKGRIVYGRKV